jgi:sugar/nucleoside kinase (ribokinase family)
MQLSLAQQTARALRAAAPTIAKLPVTVGLDGFVDTILHVVKTRQSASQYARYTGIKEWSDKLGAAAGLSANFEFVTHMVKLGGNGPIMANALAAFGFPVTYIGSLGSPAIHPVFAEFAARARKVISISEPGYTDAIEFDDGKLIFGKHGTLREVNWKNLIRHVPEDKLVALFNQSAFLGVVNWTMLIHMSDIFKNLLRKIAPKVKNGGKKWIFFDLCDPAKRSTEDLREAIDLIAKFQRHFRVILGANLQEGRQIGAALGLGEVDETYGSLTHYADKIRQKTGIDTVVIHPVAFAAGADGAGSAHVVGPFCAKPLITTGAGDHFNSGFCLGRVLGLSLAESLQLGVATSGSYVRTAKSPTVPVLTKFLASLGG